MENILQADIFFVERKYKNFLNKEFVIENQVAPEEKLYAECPIFQLRAKIDVYPVRKKAPCGLSNGVYLDKGKTNKYFSVIGKISSFWCREYRIADASGCVVGFIKEGFSFTGGNYAIEDSRRNKIAVLRNNAFVNWRENLFSWYRQNYSFDLLKGSENIGEISIEQGFVLFKAIVDLSQDAQKTIDRRIAISLVFLLESISTQLSSGVSGA